jgi:4-hydroxy-tetrahydrodipicolinate reductase
MQDPIKIGIIGGTGRMGQQLIKKVVSSPLFFLSAVFSRSAESIPQGTDHLSEVFKVSDIVIDFSHISLIEEVLLHACRHKKPLIMGITGLSKNHYQNLAQAAQEAPIVYSANMSIGIALLQKAVRYFSQNLDESFDRDLLEIHHRYKKDAPSGTSLALAQCLIPQGHTLEKEDLHSSPLLPRPKGKVGLSIIHAGGVLADQQVLFTSDTEQITLSHRCLDRSVYAEGALKAALWIQGKNPGLYSMDDVLEISQWIK